MCSIALKTSEKMSCRQVDKSLSFVDREESYRETAVFFDCFVGTPEPVAYPSLLELGWIILVKCESRLRLGIESDALLTRDSGRT